MLAQLVERMAGSHEVTGSNPVHSTIEFFQVLYGTCFFIVRDRDDLYGVRADEVEMRPRCVSRGVKRASDAFLTFRPTDLAREGSAFSRIDIRLALRRANQFRCSCTRCHSMGGMCGLCFKKCVCPNYSPPVIHGHMELAPNDSRTVLIGNPRVAP